MGYEIKIAEMKNAWFTRCTMHFQLTIDPSKDWQLVRAVE